MTDILKQIETSDNKAIIQAITEMLPDAPFPVLEFVYWYMRGWLS